MTILIPSLKKQYQSFSVCFFANFKSIFPVDQFFSKVLNRPRMFIDFFYNSLIGKHYEENIVDIGFL